MVDVYENNNQNFLIIITAFFCFIFQAESPSSGKFTALALYLVTCLLFLVGVFIESIFILHEQQGTEEKMEMELTIAKWKLAAGKISNNVLKADKSVQTNTTKTKKMNTNIKKIDIYAFIISAAMFFVFNIIYWIYYLAK